MGPRPRRWNVWNIRCKFPWPPGARISRALFGTSFWPRFGAVQSNLLKDLWQMWHNVNVHMIPAVEPSQPIGWKWASMGSMEWLKNLGSKMPSLPEKPSLWEFSASPLRSSEWLQCSGLWFLRRRLNCWAIEWGHRVWMGCGVGNQPVRSKRSKKMIRHRVLCSAKLGYLQVQDSAESSSHHTFAERSWISMAYMLQHCQARIDT